MPRLVLASGSPYRKRLLARLDLPFECVASAIDETRLPGESPETMVRRLSEAKAHALAQCFPEALIIGSDQAGTVDGRILGKPGSIERACEQLRSVSGRELSFLTGLCVLDTASGRSRSSVESCVVRLKVLSDASIRDYVERERPLDCAGSFRIEGLGVALFRSVSLDDPAVLEGLPLIRLVEFLEHFGVSVLAR